MADQPLKTVQESVTEWSHCLLYEDINGTNHLFGGRIMAWIDEVACVAAERHCGCDVVTAAVDNLQFRHGAVLNDIVVIVAKVTYVGRTSIEVRVDSYVEDRKTGQRQVINRAYLTEVCVDEHGNPQPVPYGLQLVNESEQAEWDGALRRIEMRKLRRQEGF